MANRAASYTQADVSRLVKGAVAAGLVIKEVVASEKGIRIICLGESSAEKNFNTIDRILDGDKA